ncbi:hypothetical protein DNTS_023892, partial [Danionella cerebrum]
MKRKKGQKIDGDTYTKKPKLRGLPNRGATCYLNTVLQMLFMTERFREAVERFNGCDSPLSKAIQVLFETLKVENETSTNKITDALQDIIDELKINVCKQADAAKYLQNILRKLDKDLSGIFQGEMIQTTSCLDPEKTHDPLKQVKPFFMISVSLNSDLVQECFDSYFDPIIMSGEGRQLSCRGCGKMMDTKMTTCLLKVPSVLVLHLERFEFDYEYMRCNKDMREVLVPPQLSVKMEDGNVLFELYAIANHNGSLEWGHYYAHIKNADGHWFEFNDSKVVKVDYVSEKNIKSAEAYLLLYKICREEPSAEKHTQAETLDGQTSISGSEEPQKNIVRNVDDEVITSNSGSTTEASPEAMEFQPSVNPEGKELRFQAQLEMEQTFSESTE